LSSKLIIIAALTGGIQRKSENPYLPEQPEEIAEAAYECHNEGAAVVHIHARDREGNPSGDPAIYSRILGLIRSKCNIVLGVTTGGGGNLTEEDRMGSLIADPAPEIASLNMGTMVRTAGKYAGNVFSNPRSTIERYAEEMLKRNIKPEMEVYNCSMYREVKNLIDNGLVKKPYYVNLVLGMPYQGGIEGTPRHLFYLSEFMPPETIYCVTAIGRVQLHLTTMAMIMGGMVRVGMEDNIYYRKGELVKSNAQLVARIVRVARELDLEIASPDEARKMLGISQA
jgi:3-keto-5-aminohexanoate cleavage enzyme